MSETSVEEGTVEIGTGQNDRDDAVLGEAIKHLMSLGLTYSSQDAIRRSMKAHGYHADQILPEHDHGLPEITAGMLADDRDRTERLSKAAQDGSLDVGAGTEQQVIPHGDGEPFPCPTGCPRIFALARTRDRYEVWS